jgi:hypothetical protein
MGDSGSFWENETILEKAGWQLADGKITTLSAWAGLQIVTYDFGIALIRTLVNT